MNEMCGHHSQQKKYICSVCGKLSQCIIPANVSIKSVQVVPGVVNSYLPLQFSWAAVIISWRVILELSHLYTASIAHNTLLEKRHWEIPAARCHFYFICHVQESVICYHISYHTGNYSEYILVIEGVKLPVFISYLSKLVTLLRYCA